MQTARMASLGEYTSTEGILSNNKQSYWAFTVTAFDIKLLKKLKAPNSTRLLQGGINSESSNTCKKRRRHKLWFLCTNCSCRHAYQENGKGKRKRCTPKQHALYKYLHQVWDIKVIEVRIVEDPAHPAHVGVEVRQDLASEESCCTDQCG